MEKKQFLDWKDKYWNVYYVEIADEEFLFRELSRSEYKRGLRLYSDDMPSLEEYICRTCVLEPEGLDFEECIAGLPTSLSKFILHESGFTEDTGKLTEYIDKYRKEMETLDNQIACIINEAFPSLSMEEIEDWPMEKTIWYYSRAEYILNILRGRDLTMTMEDSNSQKATEQPPIQKRVQAQKPAPVEKDGFDFNLEADGTVADFPELGEIQAFMKGKWAPSADEGEELL